MDYEYIELKERIKNTLDVFVYSKEQLHRIEEILNE